MEYESYIIVTKKFFFELPKNILKIILPKPYLKRNNKPIKLIKKKRHHITSYQSPEISTIFHFEPHKYMGAKPYL